MHPTSRTLTTNVSTFLILLALSRVTSVDAFFDRKVIDDCRKNEPAKRCMVDVFDKLARVNEAIETSRKFLDGGDIRLLEIQEEMSILATNLEKKVGLEGIIVHLLVEDCSIVGAEAKGEGEEGEKSIDMSNGFFSEEDCKDDTEHIPRYNTTLIDIYKSKIRSWIEDKELAKVVDAEERMMQILYLTGKLQAQYRLQSEHRELLKAGSWINARYAARKNKANNNNMANAYAHQHTQQT